MEALRKAGRVALVQHASANTGKGRSDLIIPYLCLEVKNAHGSPTPQQVNWLREQRRRGVPAYIVRSVDQALLTLRATEKGFIPMPNEPLEALDIDFSFLDSLTPSEPQTGEAVQEEPAPENTAEFTLDDLIAGVKDPVIEQAVAEGQAQQDLDAAPGGGQGAMLRDGEVEIQFEEVQATIAVDEIEEGLDSTVKQAISLAVDALETVPAQELSLHPLQETADALGAAGTYLVAAAAGLRKFLAIVPMLEAQAEAQPPKRRTRKAS